MAHWPDSEPIVLPNAIPIRRRSKLAPEDAMREHLLSAGGEGLPVVVTDAQEGWRAPQLWSFEYFARHFGDEELIANDLAPLRADDDPPMQTVRLSMREYVSYLKGAAGREHDLQRRERGRPFYGNSWCPFNDNQELCQHIARPYFVPDSMPEDTPEARKMSNCFTKIFLGPAGTVTRLHNDTYYTHAWLSQVRGRKQFILYPPSQAHYLHAEAIANGSADSRFDPLAPDFVRFPRARAATPYVAVCEPGDTILVPCCWFHHARALSPSITLMRNFVNDANVHRFFDLYLKKQQQPPPQAPPANTPPRRKAAPPAAVPARSRGQAAQPQPQQLAAPSSATHAAPLAVGARAGCRGSQQRELRATFQVRRGARAACPWRERKRFRSLPCGVE